MKKFIFTLILILFSSSLNARDLPKIIKDGRISCGTYNYNINYELDTETTPIFCRIISFAIFGKDDNADIHSLGGNLRYGALKEHIIDVTFDSDVSDYVNNFDYSEIFFYDKQVFITLESSSIYSLEDTNKNTKVCIADNSNSQAYMREFFKDYPKYQFEAITKSSLQGIRSAFIREECELLYTKETVAIGLLQGKDELEDIRFIPQEERYIKIFAIVSKSSPILSKLARTLIRGWLRLEEKGVNNKNVDKIMKTTSDPEIQFMLGITKGIGAPFGLGDDWFYKVVKRYGNYEDFYDDFFGKNSYYKIERGKNSLIKNGGMFKTFPLLPETLAK